MKFYVAASYKEKDEANRLANNLKIAGHECTARWLSGKIEETLPVKCKEAAHMCLDDVISANVIVFMSKPKGTMYTGGGRYVEFGYALAHNKPIIVLGPFGETIFHFTNSWIYQANSHREVVSLMSRLNFPSGELKPLEDA